MRGAAERTEINERRMGARCVCFGVRKAARAVTQLYDDAFRPLGLKSTQVTLLFVIHGMSEPRLSAVADWVVMDRTSLSRNLRPLERRGLLEIVLDGADRRARIARLTAQGLATVRAAIPLWDEAQRRMEGAVKPTALRALLGDLGQLVESTRAAAT